MYQSYEKPTVRAHWYVFWVTFKEHLYSTFGSRRSRSEHSVRLRYSQNAQHRNHSASHGSLHIILNRIKIRNRVTCFFCHENKLHIIAIFSADNIDTLVQFSQNHHPIVCTEGEMSASRCYSFNILLILNATSDVATQKGWCFVTMCHFVISWMYVKSFSNLHTLLQWCYGWYCHHHMNR